MKNNKIRVAIVAILFTLLSIAVMLVIYVSLQEVTPKEVIIKEEVIVSPQGDLGENFSKQGALDELTLILNGVRGDIEGQSLTLEARVDNAIKGEDIKVIPDDFMSKVHFPRDFAEDSVSTSISLGSLLMSTEIITKSTENELIQVSPIIGDPILGIYFDEVTRTAMIPMDIFIGKSSGFYYEMMYVNQEWKISPYSIVMGIKLVDIVSTE